MVAFPSLKAYNQYMLWIVGKISKEFRQYLSKHEIPYGLFADDNKPIKSDTKARIQSVDFSSLKTIERSLEGIDASDITCVLVTGYEHYVLPASYISEHFELPGPTITAAQAATDKALMRTMFRKMAPSYTVDYATADNWQDIKAFMQQHKYPVMLKPTNLMKSMYVTQNNSETELKQNFEALQSVLPKVAANFPSIPPTKILIEEFAKGSMHTVAGFVDSDSNIHALDSIVDCITAQDIGRKDNYIFARKLHSSLTLREQESLKQAAIAGVKSLGLTSCPFHAELILTKNGAKIIEIGARIGGYRPYMYQYGNGIDMYTASIAVASGYQPDIASHHKRHCAVVELFSDHEGTFKKIEGASAICKLASYKRLTEKVTPREVTGLAKHGHRSAAVVVLQHEDQETLHKDLDFIRKNVSVRVAN